MITLTREEAAKMLHYMDDGGTYTDDYGKLIETLRARLSAPEPEPVRLRRGDILRCIETNELCTVWATSTTGKTQVKWKANDFGQYTAEQIGDLFWVEPKPEPEPVAWMNEGDIGKTDWKVWAHGKPTATMPLYTVPLQRKWQGLTDAEMDAAMDYWSAPERSAYGGAHSADGEYVDMINTWRYIEAKLKEKNG